MATTFRTERPRILKAAAETERRGGMQETLRTPTSASCTVLLCTFNGAEFLERQLQSIHEQSLASIDVHVSDDGSEDDTISILEKWRRSWTKGTFLIADGPRKGFAENFRSLVLRTSCEGHVAFCDQDDYWHPDKLECALNTLSASPDVASLYGGRSVLVNASGQPMALSPLFARPPSFKNALVQSLAAGNTMVLNSYAFGLLQESARRTEFLMHDWWAYLLITGAGGRTYYDQQPHIDYRQHRNNALGGFVSLRERPRRLFELWNGKYVQWDDTNVRALERCSDLLLASSVSALNDFKAIRRNGGLSAVVRLCQSGIRRQTLKGDIALSLAALFKRL